MAKIYLQKRVISGKPPSKFMGKRKIKTLELGTVPLLVRIGQASRLFGIGRPQLMDLVKAGKVRTIRLSPRGQHRFPTYELAHALGMSDMVARVGIPVNRDLLRNLEDEIRDAVSRVQEAFRHELRSELAKLRQDIVQEPDRPPSPPAVNKPLKGYQPQVSVGGSY